MSDISKKIILLVLVTSIIGTLAGCAPNNIGTPCPNYGRWCSKTPVNSWNDNR